MKEHYKMHMKICMQWLRVYDDNYSLVSGNTFLIEFKGKYKKKA